MPGDGASHTAINGAFAMIAAFAPKNEVEAALALQAACTHMVAMVMMARIGGGHGGPHACLGWLLPAPNYFALTVLSSRPTGASGAAAIRTSVSSMSTSTRAAKRSSGRSIRGTMSSGEKIDHALSIGWASFTQITRRRI